MEGFALISTRLKEMFRMISMGGDAELEVVDILDLFGCGVQFSYVFIFVCSKNDFWVKLNLFFVFYK